MMIKMLSLLCLVSLDVLAVTVTIDEQFQVLKVDGKEYNSNFFSVKTKLNLSQGKHVLSLKYKELFENDEDDDYTTYRSDAFDVQFNIDKPNELSLTAPKIDDQKMAKAYAKNPTVSIFTIDNILIPSTISAISERETRNKISVENAKNELHLVDNVSPENVDVGEAKFNAPNASAMLKFWWEQASETEKKRLYYLYFIEMNVS